MRIYYFKYFGGQTVTLTNRTRYIGTGAAAVCALSLACAYPAFAATVDDLSATYKLATTVYQDTLAEQEENAKEITAVKKEIKEVKRELEASKENLGNSAVAIYKHERNRTDMLSMVLESESITDAMVRYDNYTRVQNYWTDTVEGIKQERAELGDKKDKLEKERDRISDKLFEALNAVEAAKAAMNDANHLDGARYHQRQGNNSNCGATSFIVGVNILLHENRYIDNVAVWSGAGFQGDSTQSLAFKGSTWLMAHGLSDVITCKTVAGDIHVADQLKAELEQGNVVVISSGSGSTWQRADGTEAPGLFPDGHWIVFYHYEDGVFYANDSSVGAAKGAGCKYTTRQMQQWLDGRGNHFAVSMSKKHLGKPVPKSDDPEAYVLSAPKVVETEFVDIDTDVVANNAEASEPSSASQSSTKKSDAKKSDAKQSGNKKAGDKKSDAKEDEAEKASAKKANSSSSVAADVVDTAKAVAKNGKKSKDKN